MNTVIEVIEATTNDNTSTPELWSQPEAVIEPSESVPVPEPEPQPEVQPATVQDDTAATENQLTEEISTLWFQHNELTGTRRATVKELRNLRAKLAERLFAMKQLLCRVGRAGQWRGYLREHHIPRTTADRLCERYAETLAAESGNPPIGSINDGEGRVEELVQTLLPRLRKRLLDAQSVIQFIAEFARAFGFTAETNEGGVMVFQPEADGDVEFQSPPESPEPASVETPSPEVETSCPDAVAISGNGGSE